MDLLIDWGNTQLKYYLCPSVLTHNSAELYANESQVATCLDPKQMFEKLPKVLSRVLVSSVRNDEENTNLLHQLKQKCETVFLARTSAQACGVKCAYESPEFLGIDRWLGVIAARRSMSVNDVVKDKVIGIVDVGSAITLDLVDSNSHLGGHIIPGKRLMLESLKQTGRVRPEGETKPSSQISLGQSTGECVETGIAAAIEGYLSSTLYSMENQYSVARWLFTGGGGEYWSTKIKNCDAKLEFKSQLVFEGLLHLFQELIKNSDQTKE